MILQLCLLEKNLKLKTLDGKYNYLAELLSDKNMISLIFAKFKGNTKASYSERTDYGNQCIITAYEEMTEAGTAWDWLTGLLGKDKPAEGTSFGDLAYADYVSKKLNVSLTGSVSVPYPGGGGGTVYIKVDAETEKYLGATTDYTESTDEITVYKKSISGASGGTKTVNVKLTKTFTADFYPSEEDVATEDFTYTGLTGTIVT